MVYQNGGGSSIGGLINGQIYYVILHDATHIELATSLLNAEDGVPIFLTSTGTGDDQTLQATISLVTVGDLTIALPTAIDAQIVSVTAAGAGGENISGAGAVSLNFVRMDVNAAILDTPVGEAVEGAEGVSVQAQDTSKIGSRAGSLGITTGSGAAINASVGVNDIKNSVTASITGADVQSSGGAVTVQADETAQDINVVVGGAVSTSGGNAFGGSLAFNFIQDTVGAAIQSNASAQPSDVTAFGTVSVLADDTASIGTLAGNVGAAIDGSGSASVAFAFNQVADNDTATIDDSMVTSAAGDIDVDAEFVPSTNLPPVLNSQIAALAISGSGADTGAGAGSVTLNWIKNTVAATIENVGQLNPKGTAIQAAGAVRVTANDSSTIESLAGAIAIAGIGAEASSFAIGASVAYNYLGGDPSDPTNTDGNRVTATIENVTGGLSANQIVLQANNTASISNVTVAGSGAGIVLIGWRSRSTSSATSPSRRSRARARSRPRGPVRRPSRWARPTTRP